MRILPPAGRQGTSIHADNYSPSARHEHKTRRMASLAASRVVALRLPQRGTPVSTRPAVQEESYAGVIAAWDRAEAYMAARKHAAVAEFMR
jgi:hypothetical protein